MMTSGILPTSISHSTSCGLKKGGDYSKPANGNSFMVMVGGIHLWHSLPVILKEITKRMRISDAAWWGIASVCTPLFSSRGACARNLFQV